MKDHLVRFDTEVLAQAAAAKYWIPPRTVNGQDEPGSWRSDICFTPRCYTVNGTEQITANMPDGSTRTFDREVRVYDPRFFLWVSLPEVDPDLAALPGCVIIADRDKCNAGDLAYIVQSAVDPENIGKYHIEPTVLGSNYPFGQV